MKLYCAKQGRLQAVVCCVFALGSACAQTRPARPLDAVPTATASAARSAVTVAGRAFPRLHLHGGIDLTYLGMFSPDGLFHAPSRLSDRTQGAPGEQIPPARYPNGSSEPSEVPTWMLLSSERIVENLEPPAHAQGVAAVKSSPAHMRDHAVTFIYGRPSVVMAPRYVVTDSHQRVVLSDPDALTVHVLDPRGRTSFRLVCGTGHRVHVPAGVATDAEDNIYVADSEHGMVAVFDSGGNFLRYVGTYQGEPDYAGPRGIAIDRVRRHLFVVDTPRNQVFELDLDGKLIKRFGKNRRGEGTGNLDSPTDVAINHEAIFVLDRSGTRVQVLNKNFDPVRSFDIGLLGDPQFTRDNGLSTDQEGSVYVSQFRGALVRVYSPEGLLMATFGQLGSRAGQFLGPRGLWISGQNHLYVADTANGRVQVFQLKHVQ